MQVKLLEYQDWSSPGTVEPAEGNRPREDLGYADIEKPHPRLMRMIERDGGLRVPFPMLLAPEHFDDEPADHETKRTLEVPENADGRESPTVAHVLAGGCCGWSRRPSAAEFHDAVRARTPDPRQQSIVRAWADGAGDHDIIRAYAEGAFTLRQLAAALHRAGCGRSPMSANLNQLRHEAARP